MDDPVKNIFDVVKDFGDLIIAMATFYVGYLIYTHGIVEYRNGNKIKRAEFLEKLIQDFRNDKMDDAKYLLDDYEVRSKYTDDLPQVLRDHKKDAMGIKDPGEIEIRKSFDELFDFFTKLSYYRSNNLISIEELGYFKYYLNKIKIKDWATPNPTMPKIEGVRIYITTYFDKNDFEKLFNDI